MTPALGTVVDRWVCPTVAEPTVLEGVTRLIVDGLYRLGRGCFRHKGERALGLCCIVQRSWSSMGCR